MTEKTETTALVELTEVQRNELFDKGEIKFKGRIYITPKVPA